MSVTCDIFFRRFKPNEGVIIIGATNFPEALDKYVYLHVLLQLVPSFKVCSAHKHDSP